jgi:hypothetical protein
LWFDSENFGPEVGDLVAANAFGISFISTDDDDRAEETKLVDDGDKLPLGCVEMFFSTSLHFTSIG